MLICDWNAESVRGNGSGKVNAVDEGVELGVNACGRYELMKVRDDLRREDG